MKSLTVFASCYELFMLARELWRGLVIAYHVDGLCVGSCRSNRSVLKIELEKRCSEYRDGS